MVPKKIYHKSSVYASTDKKGEYPFLHASQETMILDKEQHIMLLCFTANNKSHLLFQSKEDTMNEVLLLTVDPAA